MIFGDIVAYSMLLYEKLSRSCQYLLPFSQGVTGCLDIGVTLCQTVGGLPWWVSHGFHDIMGGLQYISNPLTSNSGGLQSPNPPGSYAHALRAGTLPAYLHAIIL